MSEKFNSAQEVVDIINKGDRVDDKKLVNTLIFLFDRVEKLEKKLKPQIFEDPFQEHQNNENEQIIIVESMKLLVPIYNRLGNINVEYVKYDEVKNLSFSVIDKTFKFLQDILLIEKRGDNNARPS